MHCLTSLLTIQILGYLQVWIKYLFENFWWRQDWDVGTFVPINPDCLYVSYSVILDEYFTEIIQILG